MVNATVWAEPQTEEQKLSMFPAHQRTRGGVEESESLGKVCSSFILGATMMDIHEGVS